MDTYSQLCGALSVLKLHGADLPWTELYERMRDIGRRIGIAQFGDPLAGTPPTGATDPVHQEINDLHRTYRDMCLDRGLIRPGELFDLNDSGALR